MLRSEKPKVASVPNALKNLKKLRYRMIPPSFSKAPPTEADFKPHRSPRDVAPNKFRNQGEFRFRGKWLASMGTDPPLIATGEVRVSVTDIISSPFFVDAIFAGGNVSMMTGQPLAG